mmetsp:Transcript_81123/g.211480  ORF Transcript_81123/g.211480 Transcript_81123/m.211480 type:complete len:668 (+) Transcript_81123:85-2088(+)
MLKRSASFTSPNSNASTPPAPEAEAKNSEVLVKSRSGPPRKRRGPSPADPLWDSKAIDDAASEGFGSTQETKCPDSSPRGLHFDIPCECSGVLPVVPRRLGIERRPSFKWSDIRNLSRQNSELSRHNSCDDVGVHRQISRANSFATDLGLKENSFDFQLGRKDSFFEEPPFALAFAPLDVQLRVPSPPPRLRMLLARTHSIVADEPSAEACMSTLSEDCDGFRTPLPPLQSFLSDVCTPQVSPRARGRTHTPPQPDRGFRGGADLDLLKSDENDCRFEREFKERAKIGEGNFSIVFKARNSVDRCWYAIKRTKQRIVAPDQAPNHRQVKEAFALASVETGGEPCPNIVRYYSSWFESGQLFIQMELCESSLRDHLGALCLERPDDARCTAAELVEMVSQVAAGLDTMHKLHFVHLDIKPDNIMRSRSQGSSSSSRWKIGDLGLAEIALGGCDDVCEGDCRYLAREVLKGDLSQLTAADVFSLGLMGYEIGTNPLPLPVGGNEWQLMRDGVLDATLLPSMPPALWELLQSMVRPNPAERPSCESILQHPGVKPREQRTVSEEEFMKLQKELEACKGTAVHQNMSDMDRLLQQLKDAQDQAKYYQNEAERFRRQVAAETRVWRAEARASDAEAANNKLVPPDTEANPFAEGETSEIVDSHAVLVRRNTM